MADAHANFAYSTVATAPSPATTGTSLVVGSGEGALFPAVPFNATVWPTGSQPTSTNSEIVRVTNISTDTLTITREQEGTTARTIVVGDQIAATITAKTFTDIETALPTAVTQLTYQNRQLGASVQSSAGQNSVWLVPFRVLGGNYISASSFIFMQSFTGTVSSAVTATWAETLRWALYSNNTTNSTRFDTFISGSLTGQVWLNSNTSASIGFNGFASNSAGTGLITQQFYGMRIHTQALNSTLAPGLYAFGFAQSTSSAGYSALVRTAGIVMDNPIPVAMGTIGGATNQSIGYVDAGTFSVTSGAMPSSIGLSEIRQTNNVVPYFKAGAI